MKKAYDVLIIGAGKIGSIRAKTIRNFSSQSEIFIFDKDLKKLKRFMALLNHCIGK